ncbi:putative enzyme related to lactoylglutathione lyase [Pseudoclavibacter chungangensis]|uniref:VOC family protein n=1 Tax=Pseudoclavibacter chungangensis TaxID=587635 RepID=UPI0015C9AEF4|nr:VOC family protein [Pseudoclavibacter chungangensis]NYJ65835.1 putative enzyme related to lactoylglutathione lyase [Pseudoclavibacter chungangensis]
MLRVGSIVIRVEDLDRQVTFWTAALDDVPRERGDPGFVVLRPREGAGPNVSLDVARSERTIPPRIHLDLYTDEQDAEVARLVALGAREVAWAAMPADADFRILEDPEGNRFCVVDTSC